jgi:SIR2-like domain
MKKDSFSDKTMKATQYSSNEYCDICKNYHDFEFPEDLFSSITNHDAVIFAGAGISTENRNIFPLTLYENILLENNNIDDKNLSFSMVMSEFCKNKGGRRDLIERITERIDYVRSFPELYRSAVIFHDYLARIPCITEIVTTNWDDFFESECHATPYVYEQDMVFWEKPGRKILKLHGSINNLGSLIITFEDYEKKYKSLDSGLVGSQLKLLIAKNRLIFVGYSFNDEDFSRIFSFVRSQIGDFIKKPYIITLDQSNDDKWKKLGLEPIYTAGEYFLQVLIHKLQNKGCLIPENVVEIVFKELATIKKEHSLLTEKIKISDEPEIIYSLSYQDGLIHGFEHFLHHVDYGESLCRDRIQSVWRGYESLIKEKQLHRKWADVAYFKGYLNAHIFVLLDEQYRTNPPHYLDLGLNRELYTLQEYKNSLKDIRGRRKLIKAYAVKLAKKLPDKSVIFHHPPFS